ncbi:hypothetical protein [Microtetraspora glauca]|uniref:DUF3592 domain-containing protein n=1 Tax=Microtetraspora glauca TaxID=1996 RepID=A0ABV3GHM6_MICGL
MHSYRESPVMREPYRIVGLWVRVLLLVILLWGTLVTVLSAAPRTRDVADFRADLRAGRVTYVIYESGHGDVRAMRWSNSPLFWYSMEDPWGQDVDGTYTVARLTADLDASEARPVLRQARLRDNGVPAYPDWPFAVPVPYVSWTVKAAWIAAFVIMLGTARPRLGNRWAWFWLFTVGQIGAVMYLCSEPRSLWRGLGPQAPPPSPLGGGRGCALAVCFQFLTPVAIMGVGIVLPGLLDVLAGP